MAVPLLSGALDKTTPCLVVSGCDAAQGSPFANLFGIPVGVVGLALSIAIFASSLWSRFLPATKVMAMSGAMYAIHLQWSAKSAGFVCPWCVGSTVFLCLSAVTAMFIQQPLSFRSSALPGMFGMLAVSCAASIIKPSIPSATVAGLARFSRTELTGRISAEKFELVFFGSPICPKCAKELPIVASRDVDIVFRFAPLTRNADELEAAALVMVALTNRDQASLHEILASGPLPSRISHVKSKMNVDESTLENFRNEARRDAGFAQQLKLTRIPLILECPANEPCFEHPSH